MTRPATSSQVAKCAHIGFADRAKAMSVTSAPMKQAIGKGTSIAWIGWPKMDAVDRGRASRRSTELASKSAMAAGRMMQGKVPAQALIRHDRPEDRPCPL